jgi:integrase/recombinase XerD
LSNKTINEKFIIYQDLFNYLVYEELIEVNVVDIRLLDNEESEKTKLSEDDLKKVFSSEIETYYKDLFFIIIHTGMRMGELILLKKNSIVNIDGDAFIEIRKGETKTKTKNSIRQIPIHPRILELIKKYKKENKTKYIFYFGNDVDEKRIANAMDKKMNRRLNKSVSDKRKTVHSMRSNFISKLYDTSSDKESYIKVLAGHSVKSNITLNIYGEVNLKVLVEMVNTIDYDINY